MISVAKVNIKGVFSITGRGIVFACQAESKTINVGDWIEFTAFDRKRKRRITGIDKANMGLLIACENENEMEELSMWKPEGDTGLIFKE